MRRLLQWLLQRLRLVATVIDESGGEDAAGVACDHVDGLPLRARACVLLYETERWFKSVSANFLWPVDLVINTKTLDLEQVELHGAWRLSVC